jgi:hypothetical protein
MISNIKDRISHKTTTLSVLYGDEDSESGDSRPPSRLYFQYIFDIDSKRLELQFLNYFINFKATQADIFLILNDIFPRIARLLI